MTFFTSQYLLPTFFQIDDTTKTNPLTYISPNCMMPILHGLENLYYVATVEQSFSCQYVEMWRWTASVKYFTRPVSCGPQVGCYKKYKILHQKIWTGNKKHFFFLNSQWRAIIWTDKCNTYKDSSFITHMLNADMAIVSQTVTDTIKHTSTRERLYGDMSRPRLSTMYNCVTCLLPCSFMSKWQCLQQH